MKYLQLRGANFLTALIKLILSDSDTKRYDLPFSS